MKSKPRFSKLWRKRHRGECSRVCRSDWCGRRFSESTNRLVRSHFRLGGLVRPLHSDRHSAVAPALAALLAQALRLDDKGDKGLSFCEGSPQIQCKKGSQQCGLRSPHSRLATVPNRDNRIGARIFPYSLPSIQVTSFQPPLETPAVPAGS